MPLGTKADWHTDRYLELTYLDKKNWHEIDYDTKKGFHSETSNCHLSIKEIKIRVFEETLKKLTCV